MSDLYGRKIEVITDARKFSGDDFTIYFEVPFDDDAEPNITNIEIYNLTDGTINEVKKGAKVTLNAGYQNDVGTIFAGDIKLLLTDWQRVDKVTSIDCMDSGGDWTTAEVDKTYKSGMKASQVLTDLLKLTGLTTGALKLPTDKVYKSGKTVKGKLPEAIAQVVKDCGAKLHINKRKIFIRPKNEGDNIRFVLDKDHGLIGSPTQVEKEEKYFVVEKVAKTKKVKAKTVTVYEDTQVEKTRTRRGWKVVSLLNHRITTDSIIEIKSLTVNGTFRVESGEHICNGSDFYTITEVYPL